MSIAAFYPTGRNACVTSVTNFKKGMALLSTRVSNSILLFINSLQGTIAWCADHSDINDTKNSLRTKSLRPTIYNPSSAYGNDRYKWGSIADSIHAVQDVAEKRSFNLVPKPSTFPEHNYSQGRLLCCVPERSIHDALAEQESGGFFDEVDIPPWDTWVYYLYDKTKMEENTSNNASFRNLFWGPNQHIRCLLCWVPVPFFSLAEAGMLVNPTKCIFWADESTKHLIDTPFLKQILAQGLIQ